MFTRQAGARSRTVATSARVLAVVVVTALTVAVAGSALAYWPGRGGGTGSGATGTALPLTLTPGTADTQLYPGAQSSVKLVISNSNPASVPVGSLALATGQGTGGFAVDAAHSACALATLSYTTQTNAGNGWTVPARVGSTDGSLSITLTTALAMSTSAANACQSATFTVYLFAGP